jgi:hypothetical protein
MAATHSHPSLEERVRAHLATAIQSSQDDHTAEDILRVFREQATLLFETERVKTALTTDPFEHLDEAQTAVKRLQKLLLVTDYYTVATHDGYSKTEAVLHFPADTVMKPLVESHVQLHFRYERQAGSTATVGYSIDLSKDHGEAERMLWVQVQAAGSVPSSTKAKNLADDDDDEGLWSDMEEGDSDKVEEHADASIHPDTKKAKTETKPIVETAKRDNVPTDEEDPHNCDRFVAGIDPDLLARFLRWTRIGPIDDITMFFLLMTFPFYEHEWDLVGYLLDAVFASDDDDDDDEESKAGD